ncbi:MAG TPA: ATP synthase subunit I [Steroidobacteraceae bacterium]|nr:ATP synthase subunit I [Steroidobacteraceae bacterium]
MSVATGRDHRQRGRRLVLRFAGVQLAATTVAAVTAFALAGARAAGAAFVGGLVVAVGNMVFGWKLFAPGVAPVGTLVRAVYAGEVLKWLWLGLALWASLGPAHLPPLPLVAGLIASQIGFWLGLAIIR